MRRRITVRFTDTPHAAYVAGRGSRSLLMEVRGGRAPMWSATHHAWATTAATARDVIAAAERRRYIVAVEAEGASR